MDKKRGCFLVLRKPLLFVPLFSPLLICGVRTYCSVCGCVGVFLNSRTYAQGHTPTVIQGGGGGGGGVNGTPS